MAQCYTYNEPNQTYRSPTIRIYRPPCQQPPTPEQPSQFLVGSGGGSPGYWTYCLKTSVHLKNCSTGNSPEDSLVKKETTVTIKKQNPILKEIQYAYSVENIHKTDDDDE